MKMNIPTIETAHGKSRPIFAGMIKALGFVPNVYAIYGDLPAALNGFATLTGAFGQSSLSSAEREVVSLSVSVENGCRYCVAGHTVFGKAAGLGTEHIDALRAGKPLSDPKLDALARFSAHLARNRGHDMSATQAELAAVGYNDAQMREIIIGVCNKMISNMTATMLNVPLDEALVGAAWSAEERVA
jgi:uncharacterized peroxidase-related enzyme